MPTQKPVLLSDRLSAAMSHPTRLFAMTVFWEREASPREIAAELDEPVNNVNYHVTQLVKLGWIELVAQRPAHGGRVVENFYKAIKDPLFRDDELARLNREQLRVLDMTSIELMSKDISEAMLAGTFFAREDNHLTRIPIDVDEEGWRETKEILEQALEELLTVRETVLKRTASTGEKTFPTKVEMIQIVSPPRKRSGDADPA